ncbi:MAG: hypothetical protein ONB37_12320 [candidate division KSB1 bacterium]|nr:hypothetical protein [candidate division KSB1 bacterium]
MNKNLSPILRVIILFGIYFTIISVAFPQQDSIIVMLKRVSYSKDGEKHPGSTVYQTVYLGTGPKLPIEFTPSLTFGSTESKDYMEGSSSSRFQTYFDLNRTIDPFWLKLASKNVSKTTPLLIYNFLIRPERLSSDKIRIKLAYEKNEFVQFSSNNHPIYEKSFMVQEFDADFDKPRELFVVATVPSKIAAEIVIQHPIRPPIESKISTDILEKLANLKALEIPVTFYIEYMRKDSATGKVIFRKQTVQKGYNRDNPFSLEYLIETPKVFLQNDRNLNYAIRGYFVPLALNRNDLDVCLIIEQKHISSPGGHVGHGIKKELKIKKGEKLEIELVKNNGTTGFQNKSGEYIIFEYAELFKGMSESLLVTVEF